MINETKVLKKIIIVAALIAVAVFAVARIYSPSIESVTLSSPANLAMMEQIDIVLSKKAPIFVNYWEEGSKQKFCTVSDTSAKNHSIKLLLLKPGTKYHFEVVVDQLINSTSKQMSFKTMDQAPWLKHNWIKPENPHDSASLGGGLVMICSARLPGYIAMVDGAGVIRWYWQIEDIGVRAATLTPHGTIIAMLRPPVQDVIDDIPKIEADGLRDIEKPIRRGAIGFAGGTGIAEIDLTGKMLWRINMDTLMGGAYKVIHHDVRMDKNGNVVTLTRNKKRYDMSLVGGKGIDTLGGEGILVIDKTGKKVWEWNIWDHWNIEDDKNIKEFAYDRFHANSLNFDLDGNYLLSLAIEDQIWKINAKTGNVMWKFGKSGDFAFDSSLNFSFQHSVHINPFGDLMVFDNSLWRHQSGGISFSLDTINKTATPKIRALLPRSKYTSRMGSAYVLPNNNLLQCSSKTGCIMVTDTTGKILWELNSYFVPYRAEYVPPTAWIKYFQKK